MKNHNFILKLVLGVLVIILLNVGLILTITFEAIHWEKEVFNPAIAGVIISGAVTTDGALLGYLFASKKHSNGDEEDKKDKKEDQLVDKEDKKE